MKCPDCGYECLPDDKECLACGINIKFALERIEQSKKRSIEANERLAQQTRQFRKELGLGVDDDEEIAGDKQSKPVDVPTPQDTETFDYKKHLEQKVECPKCGFENHESDKECFKCGVIFEKFANGHREPPLPPDDLQPQTQALPASLPSVKQEQPAVFRTQDPADSRSKDESDQAQTPGNATKFTLLKKLSQYKTIIGGSVAVLVLIGVVTYFGMNFIQKIQLEKAKQAEITRLNNLYNDFIQNKYVIKSMITGLVEKSKFAQATQALEKYRIDKLAGELQDLDNYIAEMKLFNQVLKVPAIEYEKNYRMFSELIRLNPEKPLYREKRDYYKLKYASKCNSDALHYFKIRNSSVEKLDNALNMIDQALKLRPGYRPYLTTKKKLITEKLLFYDGNNKIKMAVRNDGLGRSIYAGQRKLTLWVKNVSQEPVYINVQYFTMIGTNQKKYTYNDVGKRMAGKLMPGEETNGELYFRTRARPSEVVFSHLVCGTISRTFP